MSIATQHKGNGKIPSGWRLVSLGEVCDVQLGKMLSPKSKQGTRPIPYLRNANVQWGRFDLGDVSEMDFSEREENKFLLRRGDLLVCEGGEPGRAAIWDGEIDRCCYQKALHRIRPLDEAIDPHFVMFRLWLGAFAGEFTNQNAKTTIAHLPEVRLVKLPLALPSLNEQRRITARLREQFAETERARVAVIAQLKAAETLIEALLRDSLRTATPCPVNGCLREVTEGIGQNWNTFTLLGATRAGLAPAKDPLGKSPERYKPVNVGTIFYNPMRILLGSIAMVDEGDEPGITSPDYVVMKGVESKLHPRWFYYWFRSSDGGEFVKSLSRGAVRERLLFRRLANASVPLPEWAAQDVFAKRVREIRHLKAGLTERLNHIEKIPIALLRDAFAQSI